MDLACPVILLRLRSMEGVEDGQAEGGSRFPPYLRLVWSNPHPPAPRRPMNLAAAIEQQMAGHFGLTDQEFVTLFAKR
jgi:hypothetical protein